MRRRTVRPKNVRAPLNDAIARDFPLRSHLVEPFEFRLRLMNVPMTTTPSSSVKDTETGPRNGSKLSSLERQTLERHENAIDAANLNFIDVGRALAAIRDERLYRADFPSFERYCRDRFGYSRQRAQQLIGAAEIAVHMSTRVDTVVPSNESQVRPLVGRPLEEVVKIWNLANSMASGTSVTRRHVEMAVKSLFGEAPKPVKPVKPIADQLEDVLHSCRDLVDHLAGTDLAKLEPKLKAQLASIAEAVGELARKSQTCNAPAETAKRSKEELIKEARAFSRQRPRPLLNFPANLQTQK